MGVLSDQNQAITHRTITPRTNVYLSLYLVIFGFFVVLVNESDVSRVKSEAALSSVKNTFFQNRKAGPVTSVRTADILNAPNALLGELKDVVDERLPHAKLYAVGGRTELQIEISAATLFFANTAAVKSDARDAMETLRVILERRAGADTVLVTVPRSDAGASDFDLRRAYVIADLVGKGPGSTSNILTGYGTLAPGLLVITIRPAAIESNPDILGLSDD